MFNFRSPDRPRHVARPRLSSARLFLIGLDIRILFPVAVRCCAIPAKVATSLLPACGTGNGTLVCRPVKGGAIIFKVASDQGEAILSKLQR